MSGFYPEPVAREILRKKVSKLGRNLDVFGVLWEKKIKVSRKLRIFFPKKEAILGKVNNAC